MTTGGFREVDHDLLADYLGGALDGTPDEAVVARLVAEDPAWAEAYALLAPAVTEVRAELAAWGGPAVEMPPEVADRIVVALAHAGPVDRLPTHDPAGPRTVGGDTADQHGSESSGASVVPPQPTGGSRRPAGLPRSASDATTGPGRRRRRWARLAGPVALTAVAVAAVGLGLNQLGDDLQVGGTADNAATGTAGREDAGPASAAAPFRTAGPPVRSGTDYTPEALRSPAASVRARQFSSPGPASQPEAQANGDRVAGPVGLERLAEPTALEACLAEIGAEHGDTPLVVESVDYARFQGRPALVVRFADVAGAHWAWVSGPECGVPGSGSDSRYRTRVG